MKITKEIKTGILVIASIALFIWGYSFLKGKDLLTSYKILYVQYDNVEGLASSAPITINGLVVGKIRSITLQQNTGKLIVELQIKNDFPISKSSKVNIYEPGLIGGKQLQIVLNLQDKNNAQSGETLSGGIIPGLTSMAVEKLTPLQLKVEKMITSADVVLTNLNKIIDVKTQENIKSSIENFKNTLEELHKTAKTANVLLENNKSKLNSSFTNIDKAALNFSKISDSLAKANIANTVRNLEKTLANADKVMNDLQSGKGTLGKLLKDDALYINFNNTSKELEILLQDLRLNPTRYINVSLFGKKNKEYVAPKKDSLQKHLN